MERQSTTEGKDAHLKQPYFTLGRERKLVNNVKVLSLILNGHMQCRFMTLDALYLRFHRPVGQGYFEASKVSDWAYVDSIWYFEA